jgi:crotonobetainyl-CoA:carnitine CoA-transferase CaiB-like acyl-CoA transferase
LARNDAYEPASAAAGLLHGVRVLDLSPLYAGAMAGALLADLGADVITVEHPRKGSPMRTMLPQKDGESLWWKVIGRGKRGVTVDLSKPDGGDLIKRLCAETDILIENFRPGTLERWGLGPEDLAASCDQLIMLRISGYGQTGPLRDRPGYGTVAEAMSGFANLNGEPGGAPTFPSVSLADGVAATFGAFGAVSALLSQRLGQKRGVQVVDVALTEALLRLIPVQLPAYDQLGVVMRRPGNFLGSHGVLRNLYRTLDGTYFCVSAIGPEPIRRIISAVGQTDLELQLDSAIAVGGADFESFLEQADRLVTSWAGEHTWAEVDKELRKTGAVYQRVYDAEAIADDEQYRARQDVIRVPDPVLGPILMPGVVPKFPGFEHEVRWAGPRLGAHNQEVLGEMAGLPSEELDRLHAEGTI